MSAPHLPSLILRAHDLTWTWVIRVEYWLHWELESGEDGSGLFTDVKRFNSEQGWHLFNCIHAHVPPSWCISFYQEHMMRLCLDCSTVNVVKDH